MLTLAFYRGAALSPATSMTISDLRVTGGAIWNPTQHGLIASYTDGSWKHRGSLYSRLALTGGGCIVFGITRDSTIASDVIDQFSFIGPTLIANGVGIAKYIEQQDSWHGLVQPMWWSAMRIVSGGAISAWVDCAKVLPNPEERGPGHRKLVASTPSNSDPHQSGPDQLNHRSTRH